MIALRGEGARAAKTAKQLIDLVGKIFCDNATSAQVCDYIWDEQNMWQMGTFPSVSGYQALRPFCGYFISRSAAPMLTAF